MYNSGFRSKTRTPDGVGTVAAQVSFVQKSDPTPTVLSWAIQGSDDRALDPAGGQTVVVTGAGFTSGMTVTVGSTAIGSVTIVSSTRATFTAPAKTAGNYTLTIANSNGQAAILVPGLAYSTIVTWSTSAGNIGTTVETTAFTESVVATADSSITYALASGTLPTGATLNANGTITGTAVATASPTTYSFAIIATDAELQDSTQSFTITVNPDTVTWVTPSNGTSYSVTGNQPISNVTLSATAASGSGITYAANALPTGVTLSGSTISGTPTVAQTVSTLLTATANTTTRSSTSTITWTVTLGDIYWPYVSLLLNGATPTTTFINDTSLNNSQLTIAGDTKPNNFNPYEGNFYSNYMNGQVYSAMSAAGSSFYLTGDFTIESWIYPTSLPGGDWGILDTRASGATATPWVFALQAGTNKLYFYDGSPRLGATALTAGKWYHLVWVRNGSVLRGFVNGVLEYYNASYGTSAIGQTSTSPYIGTKDYSISTYGTYGHISNLRVVNGTAVYTTSVTTIGQAVFTPPTTPLTGVANTVLLTCNSPQFKDSSNNNFTITPSSSAITVSSAHPFTTPTTSAYNTQYSTYFDGTGDYLATPSSTSFAFGTGNFTIEMWVYPTSASSTRLLEFGGNADNLDFNISSTGTISYYNGSTSATSAGGLVNVGRWTHVAVARVSGTVTVYVNGVAAVTQSTPSNYTTARIMYIGGVTNGLFAGCMSNVRVVKGTALYTANFTPSTTPLTAVSGTSLLTCQNSTLIDNSTNNFAITSAGQAQPIAVSPFTMTTSNTTVTSLGSAYFDGTGDFLQMPVSTGLQFGTGDFTVECWSYLTTLGTYNGIIDSRTLGGDGIAITIFSNGTIEVGIAGSQGASYITSTGYVINRWNHIAFTRSSNTVRLFLNGVLLASGTNTRDVQANYGFIGKTFDNYYCYGYISDVRLVKGTALYTANFLPPQTPLTPVANTQLLTLQYNGGANNNGFVDQSSYNNVITRNGNATQGTFSPYSQTGWSTYFTRSKLSSVLTGKSPGTGSFTYELFFNVTVKDAAIANVAALFSTRGSGIGADGFDVQITTAGAVQVGTSGTTLFTSSNSLVTNGLWYHLAIVRNGTTNWTIYLNGSSIGTISNSTNLTSTDLYLGVFGGADNDWFKGYMSNFRYTRSAIYTGNFTTPNSPLTVLSNTEYLTCQDNRRIDNSPNNFTVTYSPLNGSSIIQANSPFSGVTSVPISYSNYFDGTGDYINTPASTNNLIYYPAGTDYTMECWVYPTAAVANQDIFGSYSGSVAGRWLLYTNSDGLTPIWYQYPSLNGSFTTGSGAMTLNTWNHIAVVRIGGTTKGYLNGVERLSSTATYDLDGGVASVYIGTGYTGRTMFNGHISNLRMVRGVGVYTGAFTPSTSPLTKTQSAGTNISAITGSQTVLLTCQSPTIVDNSNNIYSLTTNGDVKPRPFNPFGTTNTTGVSYTPATNGGSMYFPSTSAYATYAPAGSDIFGTGDFTVECWLNPTSTTAVNISMASSATNTWELLTYSNQLYWHENSGNLGGGGYGSIPLNAWSHLAVSRSGTTLRMFINGVQVYSVTNSYNYSASPTTRSAGPYGGGSAPYYLSDFKITKGVALYTSNFYPGSAPATPTTTIGTTTYASNLLLNGTSGGIIDYHGTNDLETVGNTQLAPEDPYAGSYYSNYFDGTGDYLSAPANAVFQLTGDFTVEAWIYMTTINSYNMVFGVDNGSNSDYFGIRPTTIELAISNAAYPAWSYTFATGVWYHVAVTRSSNALKAFVNGTQLTLASGSATNSSQYFQSAVAMLVGRYGGTTPYYFTGNISNARIVKGTALYTANFTPSTTPLTAISGTSLLTCQSNSFKDNSTNNFTITKFGDTTVKSVNPFQQNTGKSLYFDGTGDYLQTFVQAPILTWWTGSYTIEYWVNVSVLTQSDGAASAAVGNMTGNAGGNFWSFGPITNGTVKFYYYTGSSQSLATTATLAVGQWYHLAFVNNAGALTIYINGVSSATGTITGTPQIGASQPLTLGGSNSLYFNGYIKDLRVTKGVARYTTNFTPPTTPDQTS